MMVTDVADAEIVLGKLGARLAPISGLIACGVPVAALATLLGGVDFGAIVGLFVVSVSVAVIGFYLRLAESPDWPDRYRCMCQCTVSLSPIVGSMKPVEMLTGVELHPRMRMWMGIASLIVIKAAIAWLLLWLTIKTLG